MDIVYVAKTDSENDSEELRYSLRSLKNLPHNKVFIVGEAPKWITNVTYIPVDQSDTKWKNVTKNIRTICEDTSISDDFILMNDDFFIMRPLETLPALTFGTMKDVLDGFNLRYPNGSYYIDSMSALYDRLRERGIDEPISYELHIPMKFNKYCLKQLFEEAESERLYQLRSAYGNRYSVKGTPVKDVKIFLNFELNELEYNKNPRAYMNKQIFISATGGSFKRGEVGKFVRESFKDVCKYELN